MFPDQWFQVLNFLTQAVGGWFCYWVHFASAEGK
jgi:hypothetical protein